MIRGSIQRFTAAMRGAEVRPFEMPSSESAGR